MGELLHLESADRDRQDGRREPRGPAVARPRRDPPARRPGLPVQRDRRPARASLAPRRRRGQAQRRRPGPVPPPRTGVRVRERRRPDRAGSTTPISTSPPEHVIVLKDGGPVGGPGMPEWGHIPIPGKLRDAGVTDMVRISDSPHQRRLARRDGRARRAGGGGRRADRRGRDRRHDRGSTSTPGVLELEVERGEIARRLAARPPREAPLPPRVRGALPRPGAAGRPRAATSTSCARSRARSRPSSRSA